MQILFFTIFDFLFVGWLFWPITLLLLYICHSTIKPRKYSDFAFSPAFIITVIACICAYRYPSFRQYFHYPAIIGLLCLYLAAGFVTTLVKWIHINRIFKREVEKYIIGKKPGDISNAEIQDNLGLPYSSIIIRNQSVYLDREKFPFASWFTYWPFYILSLPLELLGELIDYIIGLTKGLYDSIAKSFSTKIDIPENPK